MAMRIGAIPRCPTARPLVAGLLLTLLAGAAMAACGGSSTPAQGPVTTAGEPARVAGPPVNTTFRALPTTVASRFEFVDYQFSGGMAGITRGLKVYPDGRAICHDGSKSVPFSVSAATVRDLRGALEAADMASLPPNNGTPTPDAVASRVIYGGQAVRFYSGSMPPSLGPAVTIMDRELARGCP